MANYTDALFSHEIIDMQSGQSRCSVEVVNTVFTGSSSEKGYKSLATSFRTEFLICI